MTRDATPGPTPIRCAGPGDALDAIPWILGFHPRESVVMLCVDGAGGALGPGMRLDLFGPEHDTAVARQLRDLILQTPCDQAILVVYTDDCPADPLAPLPRQDLLLEARGHFLGVGRRVRDAIVVRHGRWSSLLCDDPLCCPPEGTPLDHDLPSAVELTYLAAGAIPPMPSREALVDSLSYRPRDQVVAQLDRLRTDAGRLVGLSPLAQLRDVVGYALSARRAEGRGEPLEPAVIALLIHLAQDIACRDHATEIPFWDELPDAVALWREIYAACPEAQRPEVGGILAYLAWEAGAGALSASVCQSVLAIDPEHRLTRLTLGLIAQGRRPPARPSRVEAEAAARDDVRELRRQRRRDRAAGRSGRPRSDRPRVEG